MAMTMSVPPKETRSWIMKWTMRQASWEQSSEAVIPRKTTSCGRKFPVAARKMAKAPERRRPRAPRVRKWRPLGKRGVKRLRLLGSGWTVMGSESKDDRVDAGLGEIGIEAFGEFGPVVMGDGGVEV